MALWRSLQVMGSDACSVLRGSSAVVRDQRRFSGAVTGEPGPGEVRDAVLVGPVEQARLSRVERCAVDHVGGAVMLAEFSDDDGGGRGEWCHGGVPAGEVVARRPFRALRGVVVNVDR